MGTENPPILHIIVVGFHHKLGCQVEFSFPPLISGTSGKNECPSGWKYMPTLALPDGSHNFMEDTVFFNLPSLMEPAESVYGVSCYRQIPVEKLKIRTADVTRSTVQKSVCILTRLPIYGYIEVKLALIADAFFDQGDFTYTDLLVKAYHQLNACLLDDESRRSLRHFHVGLSLREIVLHWRHKTLILFKLFLLQRRVVCFGSPVRGMCALILGIASLIPRLLEKGWQEVACVRTSRPLSPMPDFTDSIQRESETVVGDQEPMVECVSAPVTVDLPVSVTEAKEQLPEISPDTVSSCAEELDDDCVLIGSTASAADLIGSGDSSPQSALNSTTMSTRELHRLDSSEGSDLAIGGGRRLDRSNSLTREASVDTLASNLTALASVNPDEYRAPISIFASGNLCLPYLSLPYMDLLTDPSVLSYVIGTSNFLFQQKRQLSDILVDIENANMDTHDQELRRQLVLTTEDLRFMDFIMKHVQTPKEDAEGSECWIRDQFQGYILALLRSSVATDSSSKENDHFNMHFMQAFKRTQCYQEWHDVKPESDFFDALPAGHPFAGTLSVADMKLKIAQTMQNSESGRKINQAVHTTSRAVGGAISQAKGAFSNWWSSITTAPAIAAVAPSPNSVAGNSPTGELALEQQAHEISVAFQNSQEPGEIEEGVSIHMDSSKKDAEAGSSSTSSGSEKLIDSAEELEEDVARAADNRTVGAVAPNGVAEALPIPPDLTPTPLAEDCLQQQQQQQQQTQGIVEIGREAEMLDKTHVNSSNSNSNSSSTTMQSQVQQTTCGSDAANTAAAAGARVERGGGDIYIV